MYNAVFILCLYFVSFVSFVECRRFLKKQTKMEKKNFVRNDDAGADDYVMCFLLIVVGLWRRVLIAT